MSHPQSVFPTTLYIAISNKVDFGLLPTVAITILELQKLNAKNSYKCGFTVHFIWDKLYILVRMILNVNIFHHGLRNSIFGSPYLIILDIHQGVKIVVILKCMPLHKTSLTYYLNLVSHIHFSYINLTQSRVTVLRKFEQINRWIDELVAKHWGRSITSNVCLFLSAFFNWGHSNLYWSIIILKTNFSKTLIDNE